MSDAPLPGVAAVDPLLGLAIGNYTVTSKLGEGGMGAVYLAQHPEIGKKVAVKVLLPEHSKRQDLITRFFNEAKTTALLRHPALVEVFDFGFLPDGAGYLVMDFLDGESLAARLARVAPLPPEITAELGRQLAVGVACAHKSGIVHRDLKPDNIFLVPDPELPGGERVKILDFGIAKLVEPGGSGSKGSTSTGMLLGTPLYMAPEQCRGSGLVDHRADVYSAGCILYQMLASRPPFDFEGVGEILAAHLYQTPRPLLEIDPSLPPALVDIVTRALEKDPGQRQQTMTDLATELANYLRGEGLPSGGHSSGPYASVGPVGGTLPLAASPLATPSRPGDPARISGARAEAVRSGPSGSGARSAPGEAGPRLSARAPVQGAPVQGSIATAPTSYSEPLPRAQAGRPASNAPLSPPPSSSGRPPWLLLGFVALTLIGGVGFFVLRGRSAPAPGPIADPSAANPVTADPRGANSKPDPDLDPKSAGKPAVQDPPNPQANTQPNAGEGTAAGTIAEGTPPAGSAEEDPSPGKDPSQTAGESPGTGPATAETESTGAAKTLAGTPSTGRKKSSGSEKDSGSNGRALALYEEAFRSKLRGDEEQALRKSWAALRVGGLPPNKRSEVEAWSISLWRKFGAIEILAPIKGASVLVDNVSRGSTPLPEPLLVRPGKHTVTLQVPGYAARTSTVTVAAMEKLPLKFR